MSQTEKELAPPSYEEAINSPTTPPGAGGKGPNASPNVTLYGSAPPPPPGSVPSYGAFEQTPLNIVVQPPPVVAPEILIIGGCPACRIGVVEDAYPLLALCCAIVFFPVGILCCLAMKSKRCTHCGQEF